MFSLSIPFIHTTTDHLRAKRLFFEKWAWSYRRLKKAYFHYLVFLTLMVPLKIDIRYSRNVFIVVSWEDWTLVYTSELKVSQLNKSPSPNSRFHSYIYWKLAIWRRSKKWVRHAFTKNNELYLKILSLDNVMVKKNPVTLLQKRQEVKTEMIGICIVKSI